MVADSCGWSQQNFTHVSGSLEGAVGYMCAGLDCGRSHPDITGNELRAILVNETAAAAHGEEVTLSTGDAVFCSATTVDSGLGLGWIVLIVILGLCLALTHGENKRGPPQR